MRTLLFLVTLFLLVPACTTPPPVSGSISNKMGMLKLCPTAASKSSSNPAPASKPQSKEIHPP